jgi:hypothetical protein
MSRAAKRHSFFSILCFLGGTKFTKKIPANQVVNKKKKNVLFLVKIIGKVFTAQDTKQKSLSFGRVSAFK